MLRMQSLAIKMGKIIAAVVVVQLAHMLVFSPAWGAQTFRFSAINVVLPLLYTLLGSVGSALFVAGCGALKMLGVAASLPFTKITWGLPTQAALLVWRFRTPSYMNFILNVALPASAMVLFITYPTIGIGAWYAGFWLIPMGLYYVRSENVFKIALQATFVAHAVGSVLWLYAVPMLPEQWLGLIPVVAIERGIYAIISGAIFWLICAEKKPSLSHLTIKVTRSKS